MLDINIHRNILINILKDVFIDFEIAPYLGFKGGTAAMLFYNLPRFSVDLDFDLLNKDKEEIVYERVRSILENYGNVKAQQKRYSLFFLLSYKEKLHMAQNIKVEINKRQFSSDYEIKHFLGIPMKVMVQKDMVAHKFVAMYERIGKTNRDIFDIWFFLNNHWPVNEGIIENRTGLKYKEFLKKCIDSLQQVNNKKILSGIGELLDEKQKAWVKANLINETIFQLKLLLNSH